MVAYLDRSTKLEVNVGGCQHINSNDVPEIRRQACGEGTVEQRRVFAKS